MEKKYYVTLMGQIKPVPVREREPGKKVFGKVSLPVSVFDTSMVQVWVDLDQDLCKDIKSLCSILGISQNMFYRYCFVSLCKEGIPGGKKSFWPDTGSL